MARSKYTVAVLFALLAMAATLQPSEARVQPTAAANQEEATATTTANGGSPSLPGLPLPQIPGMRSLPPIFRSLFPPLPQIPGLPPLFGPLPGGAPGAPPSPALPSLPHLPLPTGSPSPPPPKECLTPLTSMIPCMDYLTNITVFSPPDACCDGLKSVVSTAPICLCHGLNNNGGMSKLFPKPIDPIRMIILPVRCGAMIPIQTIFSCGTQPLPPLMPPATTPAPHAASPAPSP
ncbi:non-specific lipid-transfer protein C6-like [Triticum dicoccoides]|uniref:non-specific lipid-transfer protein C6-like n=1 Tax=Triticum dicoccoides TaxID=85692 RepID=UPI0003D42B27|nr:non-specific lipid-transfer protein C6-like [Triticum dicoccoides]XP_044451370.1 vegetative cell wall protein gp1-like [Triticum aestivum]